VFFLFNHALLEAEDAKRVAQPQPLGTRQKDAFALIHGQRYVRGSTFLFAVNFEEEIGEPTRTDVLLARINQ
jgi:hypothetical protein